MNFEVTASRKRPQDLTELSGQDFVVDTLKNSIQNGRIAHAYLFSGPRGVGKTSSARILARSLNCEQGPSITPCGVCSNCIEIAKGNSLDVIEIDGASNTGVNDIREIKDEVLFSPNSSRYKIYIIDEVHMLSNSAFNALLKTIEEPPPYIIFIFATTEIHKIPATIRSRCQQFNFRLVDIEQIKRLLEDICKEQDIQYNDDALYWIARESTGSVRDAYTLFDQVVAFSDNHISLQKIREKLGLIGLDQLNELIELIVDGQSKEALETLDCLIGQGISIEQFIVDLAEYFRSLLFIKFNIKKESLIGHQKDRFSEKVVNFFSTTQLEKAIEDLFELFRNIRFSLSPRFELELFISKLSGLKDLITPGELRIELLKMKKTLEETSFPQADISSEEKIVKESSSIVEPVEERTTKKKELTIPKIAEGYEKIKKVEDPKEEKSLSVPVQSILPKDIEEAKATIFKLLDKRSFALEPTLKKAKSWTREDNLFILEFETPYEVSVVKNESKSIAKIINENLGWNIRIDSKIINKIDRIEKNKKDKDHDVELICSIFRGTVVGDK